MRSSRQTTEGMEHALILSSVYSPPIPSQREAGCPGRQLGVCWEWGPLGFMSHLPCDQSWVAVFLGHVRMT